MNKIEGRYTKIKVFIIVFALVIISVATLFLNYLVPTKNTELKSVLKMKSEPTFTLNVSKDVFANIKSYKIYGTHFNLSGSMPIDLNTNVEKASIILKSKNGKELVYPLNYMVENNQIEFKTADKLNTGIDLEGIPTDDYYVLLKLEYIKNENTVVSSNESERIEHSTTQYYSLNDESDDTAMAYYTITKNNSNNKIDIKFDNITNDDDIISVMNINVEECELPDDVYDIVIDPGHGGADGGSVSLNGEYTEANIVLDIAERLKTKLEKLGLKVKLTRDGNEDPDISMAYTMYDEDGRVNIIGDSKAKICISLHTNSLDQNLSSGGVQVYCPYNTDIAFATSLANQIIDKADTNASNMVSYALGSGVFCRTFDDEDLSVSASISRKYDYELYDMDETTNYLFMIRETGGKQTGAYMDGRDKRYGVNKYRNSNIGVETYLIELGYISHTADLNNLLSNQDGYAEGIANAVEKKFSLSSVQ